jgi:uncharacterized membrane protein YbhN (UPF0104 family)
MAASARLTRVRESRVRDGVTSWLSGHHRHLTPAGVLAAVLVGAALAAGALAGVGWVAGFGEVFDRFNAADWNWLPLAVGCIVLSHVGYAFAYREVVRCHEGPTVSVGIVGASVLAGFGMLIPRAGFTMDRAVLRDHGMTSDQARGTVLTLGMLEYALLAPATLVAATVLFIEHFPAQGGVLISWVIGVPAGTAITMALIVFRKRLPQRRRVGRTLREVLDAVASLRQFSQTAIGLLAIIGMAVYWAADIGALGACFLVVRHAVPVSVLVVGYATGYAMTRRSMPFAGAGAAEALMPFAMHWMSVPLAAAVLAVFAYRLCNLWLPLAPAAVALRHLRNSPLLPASA